ncbi:hypothetical protein ACHAW6_001149 [Cyclotella cf. meneghiniana]
MFELSAYSSGVNVALRGSAEQSSVLKNSSQFVASKAIDGNSTTFSHTDDSKAYWEVNLNGRYNIESVVISNRWCISPSDVNGCLCRLSNATLQLLDETQSVIAARSLGNTCGMLMVSQPFVSNSSCVTLPPSKSPSKAPTADPTRPPSKSPSESPSVSPFVSPSGDPTASPTLSQSPSLRPSLPSVGMSNSPTHEVIHTLSVSSERNVNLSVHLGECADPLTGLGYSLGSILSICIKTPDPDVVISGFKDVFLTDSDGINILLIVDSYGRTSFTSSLYGIGSSSVDLSTLMLSSIYDQGYGGTLIDVRGTVLIAYVADTNSRSLRHLLRSEISSFTVEFVVGGAMKNRPQIVDAMMRSPSAADDQHSSVGVYIVFIVSALILSI